MMHKAPLPEGPEGDVTCPMQALPEEWKEPDYVRAFASFEEKVMGYRIPDPTPEDGTVFASLHRELVQGLPSNLAPQPARQDLRKLTCATCGQPASPHRADHAAVISIPPRYATVPA